MERTSRAYAAAPRFLLASGWAGLIGCVAVVTADVAGIVAYESYSPIRQSISALAVGQYAWIQDLGLAALSAGLVAAAAGLFGWRLGGTAWYPGCGLLVMLGADVAGIAVVNEYAGQENVAADIHQLGVYALGLLTLVVPLLLAPGLGRQSTPWRTFSIAFALVWLVLAPIYPFIPANWDGAYERALVLLALLWFSAVANLVRRKGAASE